MTPLETLTAAAITRTTRIETVSLDGVPQHRLVAGAGAVLLLKVIEIDFEGEWPVLVEFRHADPKVTTTERADSSDKLTELLAKFLASADARKLMARAGGG